MTRVQLAGTEGSHLRRTRLLNRVLAVLLPLAAAAACWLAAEHSPRILYLLYLALALLIGTVAMSTLAWMLYAWRTPDSLGASRLTTDGRPPMCSFSLIVPARHEETVLENTLDRLIASDHPDFEVLVVVGHDDPGTRAVA